MQIGQEQGTVAMRIRETEESDLAALLAIWNEVIEEGGSIPFESPMDLTEFRAFLMDQQLCMSAIADDGKPVGMFQLHPLVGGRCDAYANATYIVDQKARGRGIGRALVMRSLVEAKHLGYQAMAFIGVVDSNHAARRCYEGCGFTERGTLPRGFRTKDGQHEDMHVYYRSLSDVLDDGIWQGGQPA